MAIQLFFFYGFIFTSFFFFLRSVQHLIIHVNTNDKVISYRRDSEMDIKKKKSKSRQIADSLMPISSNWGYTVSNIYIKKYNVIFVQKNEPRKKYESPKLHSSRFIFHTTRIWFYFVWFLCEIMSLRCIFEEWLPSLWI